MYNLRFICFTGPHLHIQDRQKGHGASPNFELVPPPIEVQMF